MTSAKVDPNPANTLGLDYDLESLRLPALETDIIDVHTHLRGPEMAKLYDQIARQFGVTLTYTMTPLPDIDPVRDALGERVRVIAFPDFLDVVNGGRTKTSDWLNQVDKFHAAGARVIKFWAGPRGAEFEQGPEEKGRFSLRAPHRMEAAKHAAELGMCTMVHVGDPDFWFKKRYTDPATYGTKSDQYEPLRDYLAEYDAPCIAAHMGGWPEDLEFLDSMLKNHPNLYLDTSATKWMVRELSRHSDQSLVDFLSRWQGRILFGSDIVVNDGMMATRSKDELKDLVASRYYAYRTMLETDYDGPSPIHDPDSDTGDGVSYLKGRSLPDEILRSLYHDAAHNLLEPLYNPDGAAEQGSPLDGETLTAREPVLVGSEE